MGKLVMSKTGQRSLAKSGATRERQTPSAPGETGAGSGARTKVRAPTKVVEEDVWVPLLLAACGNLARAFLMVLFWAIVTPFAIYVFVAGVHYHVLPPLVPAMMFTLMDQNVPFYTMVNASFFMFLMLFILAELMDPRSMGIDQLRPARYGILFCLLVDVVILLSLRPDPVFWMGGVVFWAFFLGFGLLFLLGRKISLTVFS